MVWLRLLSRFPSSARPRVGAWLTWTWCLPNTLLSLVLGVLAGLVFRTRPEPLGNAVLVRVRLRWLGGVCLGPVILADEAAPPELLAHEYGHFRQHLLLGPLYLLVVGVPSVAHAAWHGFRQRGNYFHFYTEAWADAWGGVYPLHGHHHRHWTGYLLAPVGVVGVTGLVLRAWAGALGYGWTDTDALADVAFARRGLLAALTQPLTGGIAGNNAAFWRPAATAQYAVQYALFGERPALWHGWDVGLHLLVCALAATWIARRSGDAALALLATALFAVWPTQEEIVPAVARNLEPLAAAGLLGALLTVGTWAFWPLALLALGAKETSVLLVFLVPVGFRLRTLLLTVAWSALHAAVMRGVGGYDTGTALGATLLRLPVELWLPSLTDALPAEPVAWLPVVVTGVAVTAWARGVPRGLVGPAAVLVVGVGLMVALAGAYSRRMLYLPSLGAAIVAAGGLLRALRHRRRLAIVIGGAWLATWLHGSPAVRPYGDWAASAAIADDYTDPALYADLAPGTAIWLVDRPSRLDGDPRRHRLWSERPSLNHALAAYSLQAWLDTHDPRGFVVRDLSSVSLVPPVVPAQVTPLPDGVAVAAGGVARAVASTPAWFTETRGGVFTARATADLARPAVLLVWTSEGVSRVPL